MTNRVVITGMGAVTPLGNTAEESWQGICEGRNGIDKITTFDTDAMGGHKCIMGGEVKNFVYPDKRAARRLDKTSQFSLVAAGEAMTQSGIVSGENVDPYRFGIMAASGIGGIQTLESQIAKSAVRDKIRTVSALMIPMSIINLIAGNLSIEFQAKGSCLGIVTACASGTHAIGEAFRNIKHGYADVMIAGGAESAFAPICFSGFENMTATTTRTDKDRCSTPFDKERDGFVMGEGAAYFVLESLEHAQARGAEILGEVAGYGSTCDAYHITAPSPDGTGAAGAMKLALQEAGLQPENIDYINAHGTGTPLNDSAETQSVKLVFGEHTAIPMSSTKGNTGHLLGAAGAIEGIFCVQAMRDSFIPPTINLKVPDPALDLDYVPNEGRRAELHYTMSNNLGFGGHNGSLILKKYEG
ncbi:MAG: beta-ketoacyl-ACP synthase II [Eubacteriales bacterium]|nr:beta-ketoacyl-ACP synthase II [Eubacteriales bacterium]